VISHLHNDHLAGLWPLFSFAKVSSSELPDVVGPRGVVEVVSKLYDLLATHRMQTGREAPRAGRVSEAPTKGEIDMI
jgi:ribonuclease BN (tRNA processing enzyme)